MLTTTTDSSYGAEDEIMDGDHEPSFGRGTVDGVARIDSPVGLGLSRKDLPATATLPSFTVGGAPLAMVASERVVKKPREKLVTVLKEADRLLREHERSRENDALSRSKPPERRGKIEAFIMSLKEETIKRDQQRRLMDEGDKIKGRLASLVPAEVLSRRPRLSTDNLPGDKFEIVVDEHGSTDQVYRASLHNALPRPSRMGPRAAIAPKLKPVSILKLNSELDRKIREQHEHDMSERKPTERAVKKPDFSDSDNEGNADTEGGDEFGEADEGALRTDKEAAFEATDLPEMTAIEGRPLLSDEELLDGHQPAQLDFSKRRRPHLSLDDDDDGEYGQREREEDLLHTLDLGETATNEMRAMDLEDAQLSLMLSGQFVDRTLAEDSLKRIENDIRDSEPEEDTTGTDHLETEVEDKDPMPRPRSLSRKDLFEEEAEDEDSQVSADDIDEEAIARELRASHFLVDDVEEDDEGDPTLRDSQRVALYRELMEAEDNEEMQIFMNRFVPEEVLREQGVYAEIRRKYHSGVNDFDEAEGEGRGHTSSGPGESTRSKFGSLPTFVGAKPVRSHPEFLKLIEQDRLSNDEDEASTCQDDQDSASEFYEEGDHLEDGGEGETTTVDTSHVESSINTLLGESSIVISTASAMSVSVISSHKSCAKRSFIRPDEALYSRLLGDQLADTASIPLQKSNGRTFETVSSRPKISKERVLSKAKK